MIYLSALTPRESEKDRHITNITVLLLVSCNATIPQLMLRLLSVVKPVGRREEQMSLGWDSVSIVRIYLCNYWDSS